MARGRGWNPMMDALQGADIVAGWQDRAAERERLASQEQRATAAHELNMRAGEANYEHLQTVRGREEARLELASLVQQYRDPDTGEFRPGALEAARQSPVLGAELERLRGLAEPGEFEAAERNTQAMFGLIAKYDPALLERLMGEDKAREKGLRMGTLIDEYADIGQAVQQGEVTSGIGLDQGTAIRGPQGSGAVPRAGEGVGLERAQTMVPEGVAVAPEAPEAPQQFVPTRISSPQIVVPRANGKVENLTMPEELAGPIEAAAAKYGVPADVLVALAGRESSFNPGKSSPAGAQGYFGFMPATAESLGIDPMDPAQAADGAARYLRSHMDRYDGDIEKALAAYNAGQGNVKNAIAAAGEEGNWREHLPKREETDPYIDHLAPIWQNASAPAPVPQEPAAPPASEQLDEFGGLDRALDPEEALMPGAPPSGPEMLDARGSAGNPQRGGYRPERPAPPPNDYPNRSRRDQRRRQGLAAATRAEETAAEQAPSPQQGTVEEAPAVPPQAPPETREGLITGLRKVEADPRLVQKEIDEVRQHAAVMARAGDITFEDYLTLDKLLSGGPAGLEDFTIKEGTRPDGTTFLIGVGRDSQGNLRNTNPIETGVADSTLDTRSPEQVRSQQAQMRAAETKNWTDNLDIAFGEHESMDGVKRNAHHAIQRLIHNRIIPPGSDVDLAFINDLRRMVSGNIDHGWLDFTGHDSWNQVPPEEFMNAATATLAGATSPQQWEEAVVTPVARAFQDNDLDGSQDAAVQGVAMMMGQLTRKAGYSPEEAQRVVREGIARDPEALALLGSGDSAKIEEGMRRLLGPGGR